MGERQPRVVGAAADQLELEAAGPAPFSRPTIARPSVVTSVKSPDPTVYVPANDRG